MDVTKFHKLFREVGLEILKHHKALKHVSDEIIEANDNIEYNEEEQDHINDEVQTALKDLRKDIDYLKDVNGRLRECNEDLQVEYKNVKEEIGALSEQNKELRARLKHLEVAERLSSIDEVENSQSTALTNQEEPRLGFLGQTLSLAASTASSTTLCGTVSQLSDHDYVDKVFYNDDKSKSPSSARVRSDGFHQTKKRAIHPIQMTPHSRKRRADQKLDESDTNVDELAALRRIYLRKLRQTPGRRLSGAKLSDHNDSSSASVDREDQTSRSWKTPRFRVQNRMQRSSPEV